jgi:hypothetical protein
MDLFGSLSIKCHSALNATQQKMPLSKNATQQKMPLSNKCHSA